MQTQYTDKLQNKTTDTFSGTESNNENQDTGLHSSTQSENVEQDPLNWKITELLDHLVRAQSTICALEKLNVSSLLRHLPADMLESIKVSHQGPDGTIHPEDTPDLKSSVISSETSNLDICGGNLRYTGEESKLEDQPVQRMTAFTPWSPKRQRSFPALHTLYNSTESDCSLEDVLPTFRLLSPRFPNLGESFSDDRKDKGNSDVSEYNFK
ncbi:uncharacterized protein LOC134970016 [Pseudophryne corroboree]|uniref:uncharacterized protein LOC134970016 n=1 Tax=Pseudophryne corroboree TaxID=495146 RepID=UPI0030812F7A